MKKISLMKVNLQKENFLSKEERKQALGGNYICYVKCDAGTPAYPISSCTYNDSMCNGQIPICCSCPGNQCG